MSVLVSHDVGPFGVNGGALTAGFTSTSFTQSHSHGGTHGSPPSSTFSTLQWSPQSRAAITDSETGRVIRHMIACWHEVNDTSKLKNARAKKSAKGVERARTSTPAN